MRVTCGAICLSRSSHLPLTAASKLVKPVTLPPGRARFCTRPDASGSATTTNTIGVVVVSARKATVGGVARLAADGVKSASLEEIAESCRTIFLSLPGGKEVEQVCLGEGGLVSRAVLGWTVIESLAAFATPAVEE